MREEKMKQIKIGELKIGDAFYLKGRQYKVKDYADIGLCVLGENEEGKKRIWLNANKIVEVEE